VAEDTKVKGWRDVPIGGVVAPGTSEAYRTGGWRTYRPVWHADRCIHCLQCWAFCPDGAVLARDEKFAGFDLEHCKGCGLCSQVCPVKGEKAITMVLETEAAKAGR
jgi:pyruvate ferredoxin oxidoreductase delta subunit